MTEPVCEKASRFFHLIKDINKITLINTANIYKLINYIKIMITYYFYSIFVLYKGS